MSRWWRVLAPAVLVAAAIVAVHPLAEAAGKPYLASTVATAACIAIGVCGIDLGLGVGHQFMLGQSAFFGIGAYAYANFAQDAGLPVLLAAGAAVLLAAVSGAAVGWVFSKLDGLLFAVGTLAVGVIALNAMNRLTDLTGGSDGRTMGRTELFGHLVGRGLPRIVFVAIVLGLAIAGTRAYIVSARGQRLHVVGVDPVAAGALGIDVRRVRVEANAIAAALGAVGGVCTALTNVVVAPSSFSLETSILVVVAVVLGGAGTVVGPVVAVIVLETLPELVDRLAGNFDLMIGVLLVLGIMVGGGSRPVLRRPSWGRGRATSAEVP